MTYNMHRLFYTHLPTTHKKTIREPKNRHSTLTSTVDTCIDLNERVLLLDKFLPYRLVVDGTEYSHIERHRITHQTPLNEERVIICNHLLA